MLLGEQPPQTEDGEGGIDREDLDKVGEEEEEPVRPEQLVGLDLWGPFS